MKCFLTSPIPGIVLGALALLLALGVMHLDVQQLTFRTADLIVDNTAQVNGTFTGLTLQSSGGLNMNATGGHVRTTDAVGVTFSSNALLGYSLESGDT